MIGGSRNYVYYWAKEYKHSISDKNVSSKSYQSGQSTKDKVANEDEISHLSLLYKEELIDKVIKAIVGETRAKKDTK